MTKELSRFMAMIVILFGCSSDPPKARESKEKGLAPCPDSPNCVSTQSRDPRHAMPALPFLGTKERSRDRITGIVRGMKRSTITEASDSHIRAQFKTRFFRFVDDVEFFFDDDSRLVHFRSASRVGYYDFGLNRRRMQKISSRYLGR